MSVDEIKAKLGIDDASIGLAENNGWYWVRISRFHGGHRYGASHRLALNPSDQDIAAVASDITTWWNDTIGEQPTRATDQ